MLIKGYKGNAIFYKVTRLKAQNVSSAARNIKRAERKLLNNIKENGND